MNNPSQNMLKLKNILNKFGLKNRIVELPSSTRTSQEAANAVNCEINKIVKAIVFRKKDSDLPVLVLASGRNRICEKKVSKLCKEKIGQADADFIKNETGFSIGGIPPVGHIKKIQTFIDKDLLLYDEIWASAGTSQSIFRLTPKELLEISGGLVANIKKS